jgi:phage replication O-like protein O
LANPQAEDGHTDIAHPILEALARIRLSGQEWQILCIIFRKLYGWKKTEDAISLSQFASSTGLKRQHCHRSLKLLEARNIISVTKIGYNQPNLYKFIKDFDKWVMLPKLVTVSPKLVTDVTKIDDPVLPGLVTTKEIYTKEITTLIKSENGFERFWKIYPRKVGKIKAIKAWERAKTKADSEEIIKAVEKQKKSTQWKKDNGQYIPHPTTWLNEGRWMDELPEKKSTW